MAINNNTPAFSCFYQVPHAMLLFVDKYKNFLSTKNLLISFISLTVNAQT